MWFIPAAIAADNPERACARELGIPEMERCDLIGLLMKKFGHSIAISGTHGKSTTTAMMAETFVGCGEDPSVHIGGELDYLGGSTRLGRGEQFICEACEFNGSFLHFFPTVAVILNIDEDHLDYYKDLDDIENAFRPLRVAGAGGRLGRRLRRRKARPQRAGKRIVPHAHLRP